MIARGREEREGGNMLLILGSLLFESFSPAKIAYDLGATWLDSPVELKAID
jgi:hypothetical protein